MAMTRRRINNDKPKGSAVPVGTVLTIMWGEETFSPVQYNSFRSGGNSVAITVQEGETLEAAYSRGWTMLEELGEMQFQDKLRGFSKRLKQAKS